MTCEIVIFTHTEYQDIWPIILDSIYKNHLENVVRFAVNGNVDSSKLPFIKYIYDESKPYGERMCEVLEKVQSEYIFFFHDVDILMSFDKERFSMLLEWIIKEDVDRFYMGVFGSNRLVGKLVDMPIGISGKNICNWFITPYDLGPSIWKRRTFQEIMKQFSAETYRSIEFSGIQDVMLKKKVYGFSKLDIPVRFTLGRPFTEWFSFCHILAQGKWIPPNAYQSYANFYLEIPNKYKIDFSKRGFIEFHEGMTNGFYIC
jgi:hypothetical protein